MCDCIYVFSFFFYKIYTSYCASHALEAKLRFLQRSRDGNLIISLEEMPRRNPCIYDTIISAVEFLDEI